MFIIEGEEGRRYCFIAHPWCDAPTSSGGSRSCWRVKAWRFLCSKIIVVEAAREGPFGGASSREGKVAASNYFREEESRKQMRLKGKLKSCLQCRRAGRSVKTSDKDWAHVSTDQTRNWISTESKFTEFHYIFKPCPHLCNRGIL